MNAVIYARYSSHAQRDVSIDQQINACKRFAQQLELDVVRIYEDRALTGTNDRRPGFQKMIRDAVNEQWNYVIVYTLDRFARDRYDSAIYKRQLKNSGVKVLSAMENISDDPTGVLVESLLEGLAEYYSKELSRKILRGIDDNASKCMVNGSLPLGYCRGEDGRFAIKEDEAEVVREIFRRVAAGDGLTAIANSLNERGIKTKYGNRWCASSFNTMLSNERYTGTYIHGSTRIPGGVPVIIEQPLFDAVQASIFTKPNARRDPTGTTPQKRRRKGGVYLLTGKLFCGHCKEPMIGVSGKSQSVNPYYYYVCKGKRNGVSCSAKSIRREQIELSIAIALKETVLSDESIYKLSQAAAAYQTQDPAAADLQHLYSRKADIEKSIRNLLHAVESGVFSQNLQARLTELEIEHRETSRRITVLETALGSQLTADEIAATLMLFREGDVRDKKYQETLIDTFLVAAYIYDDKIRIVFHLGDDSNTTTIPFDIDSITPSEFVLDNLPSTK